MSDLTEALDRMDVVELDAEMVSVIRTALRDLKTDEDIDRALAQAVLRADKLLAEWQNSGNCSKCGGKDHLHSLSCELLKPSVGTGIQYGAPKVPTS